MRRALVNRDIAIKSTHSFWIQGWLEQQEEWIHCLIRPHNSKNSRPGMIGVKLLAKERLNTAFELNVIPEAVQYLPSRPGQVPRNRKQKIIKSAKGKCHYCGRNNAITIDHVIPISKGGTNRYKNLVAACYNCNMAKGNKLS